MHVINKLVHDNKHNAQTRARYYVNTIYGHMLICAHCMQKVLGCMKIVDKLFVSNIFRTNEASFGNQNWKIKRLNTNRCLKNANSWSYKCVPVRIETPLCSIMHVYDCFRKSKNINHNNRHIAFWNIRVAALRTRVRAYEDVAYFLEKMNMHFF